MNLVRLLVVGAVLSTVLVAPVPAGAVPTNDDLANALLVQDNEEPVVDTTGASLEGGEVAGSCEYGTVTWSVWYYFSASATEDVRIRTGLETASAHFIEVYEVLVNRPGRARN